MYVDKAVVEFRRDARTTSEAAQKAARIREQRDGLVAFGQDVTTPTLMCEQGARQRGLDLAVAAADAAHWWETGSVPLRATPSARRPWWRFGR
ncbi:hypothetical protein [Nocardia sp. XZ_19_385]|uniref:hypothetical protein n=1 Tax=Nocardia sp. XZ_19_385 TaxID=2769488 RepID=UPI00188F5FB8|nr:hypothetical protein [Nocardia sp. XZ_19_385]